MGGYLKSAFAAATAFALSGCIIVADGDDDSWTDRAAARASSPPGAFLLVPFEALEAEGAHHLFYHDVVPALTRNHALTNAGTADAPWFCFAYRSKRAAEAGRAFIAGLDGGATLAADLLVDETCAAG